MQIKHYLKRELSEKYFETSETILHNVIGCNNEITSRIYQKLLIDNHGRQKHS